MPGRLADRAAAVYGTLLASVYLLAAPYFAREGGYGSITDFKFYLYAALTGLFLFAALPGAFRKNAARPTVMGFCVLGLLAFGLASALLSPHKAVAFLGGARREGFLTLALYACSFLAISRAGRPGRRLPFVFAAAITAMDIVCLLQLWGFNPLGLYPPGLVWADANLRYPGAYLGLCGNAGLTGAVLCTASALFLLALLRKGGAYWLFAVPLLLSAYVLGRMSVTAAALALLALMLLALPAAVRTLRVLTRALAVYPLVLAALFLPYMGIEAWLAVCLGLAAAYLLYRLGSPERNVRPWMLTLFAAAAAIAFLYVYFYEGWRLPLREAASLLRGKAEDSFGSGRIYIWRQVWPAFLEKPLFGTGPDTLGLRALAPYVWHAEGSGKLVRSAIDAAHCEYLHTLVCMGLPAALCHLALPALALLRFLRAGDRPEGVCAGAAACYGIQALFGISMCAAAPVFWLLLAYSEALGRESSRITTKSEKTTFPKAV